MCVVYTKASDYAYNKKHNNRINQLNMLKIFTFCRVNSWKKLLYTKYRFMKSYHLPESPRQKMVDNLQQKEIIYNLQHEMFHNTRKKHLH